jgi:hypothetical protein
VVFEGEAEWIITALHRIGLPLDEAAATFGVIAEEQYGCDHGFVPTGRITEGFRLCRACARKADTNVASVKSERKPVYRQPEGE